MRLWSKWIFLSAILLVTCTSCTDKQSDIQTAIENGLRYLEIVQAENGEFPCTFTPNLPEPTRSLQSTYDSNLYTTVLLADTIHYIQNPRVNRMEKKVATYLQSQLINQNGLWSYVTTHNPKPVYPNTVYDLDDTAFASMVLQRQHISFPDNRARIKANKNNNGVYLTFVKPNDQFTGVDCGVNANVLSYLQENDPKVCHYLNEQVALGNTCAYYYTRMDAYYLITRAYASGVSCLKPSMTPIMNYVLTQFNQSNGSVNNSPFKTAIAVNTLLASGYHGEILKKAQNYLLKTQSANNGSWPAEDFWIYATPTDMGRASSSALTTAIALKALSQLVAI